MNRRDMLGSMAAMLLPTWRIREAARPPVPLHKFCGKEGIRFNLATPFVQTTAEEHLFAYATDCKIIVRADADDALKDDDEGRRPPATRLAWDHDSLTGWKPWPKADYVFTDDAECPRCEGYGTADGKPGEDCHRCYGYGCYVCNETGTAARERNCPTCRGKGRGRFANHQRIGPLNIAIEHDNKG